MNTSVGTPRWRLGALFLGLLLPGCGKTVLPEGLTGDAGIDPGNGLAHFETDRKRVLVVALGQGSDPPTLVDSLASATGKPKLQAAGTENPQWRSLAAHFLNEGERITSTVFDDTTRHQQSYLQEPHRG